METSPASLPTPLKILRGMDTRPFVIHGLEVRTMKSDFGAFFEITVTLYEPVSAAFKPHKIQVSSKVALRAELAALADRLCQQLNIR